MAVVDANTKVFEQRRSFTNAQIAKIIAALSETEILINGKAAVYATGSYGRGEASRESDLDLFIVGLTRGGKRELSRLDEVCVKADLIKATRELDLPEFDGDGEYLQHYTTDELKSSLGKPEDDALNTFTARLLMLLESKPLLGEAVFKGVLDDVTASYWRDYEDHRDNFAPSFLINDILRLWRTFCVNYEARTRTEPDDQKNKRRAKNYKLKHGRMLTCFSAILNMLAVHRMSGTVHPSDFLKIVSRTPIERLLWVKSENGLASSHSTVDDLMAAYDLFLDRSGVGGGELSAQLGDRKVHRQLMSEARYFGDKMYQILNEVGKDSDLLRHLTI